MTLVNQPLWLIRQKKISRHLSRHKIKFEQKRTRKILIFDHVRNSTKHVIDPFFTTKYETWPKIRNQKFFFRKKNIFFDSFSILWSRNFFWDKKYKIFGKKWKILNFWLKKKDCDFDWTNWDLVWTLIFCNLWVFFSRIQLKKRTKMTLS